MQLRTYQQTAIDCAWQWMGDIGWTSTELALGPKLAALVSDPVLASIKGEFGARAVGVAA